MLSPSPWLSAHDAFGRTYGLQQILWLGFLGLFFFFFFFTFGLGLLLAQASLIILPGEAGAAERASGQLRCALDSMLVAGKWSVVHEYVYYSTAAVVGVHLSESQYRNVPL